MRLFSWAHAGVVQEARCLVDKKDLILFFFDPNQGICGAGVTAHDWPSWDQLPP